MKILAIETSTKNLGVAIADGKSILAAHKSESHLKHSQDLIPNIDRLLKDAGLKLKDLDCFAVSIGPGSFTGLRVGVSTLKGLNMATKIPIAAIPTLDVIAYNAEDARSQVCVIVDAKKKNVYTSLYKFENGGIIRMWEYSLVSAEELLAKAADGGKEILFSGDGLAIYGEAILKRIRNSRLAEAKYWYPDVETVARLAREKCKAKEYEDPDTLAPMYIYSRECNIRGIER